MVTGVDTATAEVVLPPLLDKFRRALRAEIEAASYAAAAGAVSLVGGKRIAQVGAQYQYVFHVETPLNLPADSPGDLRVDGRGPLPATIVSSEGLVVTISVTEDLGPAVPQARLVSNLTYLLRRLIERIEAYVDRSNPAGDRLLNLSPASGRPALVSLDHLNDDQNAAVASALGRDTTFIWGPPGTGKTMTIGTLGVELFRSDRSVLLVSHTNVAVDQALLRIGHQLREQGFADDLEAGGVLRVGEPQDTQLLEQPELLLSEHARRRSERLAQEQDALRDERKNLVEQVLADERTLQLVEWVREAADDLERHRGTLDVLTRWEGEEAEETRDLENALAARAELDRDAQQARDLVEMRDTLVGLVLRAGRETADAAGRLRVELGRLDKAVSEQRARLALLRGELGEQEDLLARASERGRLVRMWRNLPDPEEQAARVDRLRTDVADGDDALKASRRHVEAARATLHNVVQQQEAVELLGEPERWDAADRAPELAPASDGPVEVVSELREVLDDFNAGFDGLRAATGRTPKGLLSALEDAEGRAATHRQRRAGIRRRITQRRTELTNTLRGQFSVLREESLFSGRIPESLNEQVDVLDQVRDDVAVRLADVDPSLLRRQIAAANSRITTIDRRLEQIAEALARVEDDLVAQAMVVATTLTRAYLRDYIQNRSFDTVILDEASMAPIPALWVAAGVASDSVVAVGDPHQLPPIKHSRLEIAEDWLGRDIFEVAGVVDDARSGEGHLVQLTTQYRMHPAISDIPNHLVYDGKLRDGEGADDVSDLEGFYEFGWGPDEPVLLVDTGPLDAWVTTVDRGATTSRLNFLSAVVSANLAERVLRSDRPPFHVGSKPRVLIVAPYRPQANLLATLIREQGLEDEVSVGTAHSFQGTEAPVVIFDLVVDEPHWRVGLFVSDYDEGNYRLLNVALTRAQSRLIVVGDFDYAATKGRRAFLGRLVDYLVERHGRVSAHEVLPVDLSAHAARAQLAATGGPLTADEDRLVVSEALYYRYLASDLASARRRVIIYSPFLTADRVSHLEPHLRALTDRGVATYVFTKPLRERPAAHRETAAKIEDHLTGLGVIVTHKRGMHEKVVLIDDDISWLGSLNTLSFTNSSEVMERRRSRAVVADYYIKHFRLEDVLGALDGDEGLCPVCREHLETAEGYQGPFWRCPEGCYTRSPDKPYPSDGKLTCATCGGEFEYGYWGDAPHWRCADNRRHRQPVRKAHLRLPAMRELIPAGDLRVLQREWQLEFT